VSKGDNAADAWVDNIEGLFENSDTESSKVDCSKGAVDVHHHTLYDDAQSASIASAGGVLYLIVAAEDGIKIPYR